ncbi:alanine racemase [Novosphingobium sp. M1R2S20]|uniref:alanine racemase n=1 Tax=Novosphingobium rhizovicinum TaxID=3228928 RepID=A0ABV3RBQ2_9SPHN
MMPETLSAAPSAALRLLTDRDALRANWQTLDRLSGAARAGAAVKANGYGIGARIVVPALFDAGCRTFFVAHAIEARDLLDLVDPQSLRVLHGPVTDADAEWMKATGITPVINSLAQAGRWRRAGGGPCDLMVDTGMNRLGIPMSALGEDILKLLEVDVLLSHLTAAEEDSPLNAIQLTRWCEARAIVQHERASLANSAGIALGADYHGDLTRPGLALYGGVPCAALDGAIRQVVRPQAVIMQVREIGAGDPVGYNATFVASAPMRVGTIALGYADGYLRCWSGKGVMRCGDRSLPVLGRVSMDMTVIDLTNAPDVGEGDWVEASYNLPDAAAASGLSQYELLTLLGSRFSR